MVFGKSYSEKDEAHQKHLEQLKNKTWFAWYPVKENYGRWVWLERVKVDWCVYEGNGKLHRAYNKPIYHLIEVPDNG